MSPSWIDSIRGFGRSDVVAGLDIGRNIVRYLEIEVKAGRHQVRFMKSVQVDGALFDDEPSLQSMREISGAIAQVAGGARHRYLPVHVSIPDPAVRTAILELEELPKSVAARTALARHRLQKDLPTQDWECRTEALGVLNSGKHLLLGVAMSSAWRRVVAEALQSNGVTAWSLAGRLPRLVNALEKTLSGASSVLICVMDDSWTLAAIDQTGRLRYVRSQWRTSGLTSAAMAEEAQRATLAYVHQDSDRTVEKIRIFSQCGGDDLAMDIDARADEACHRLGPGEFSLDLPPDPALGEYGSALAAALQ